MLGIAREGERWRCFLGFRPSLDHSFKMVASLRCCRRRVLVGGVPDAVEHGRDRFSFPRSGREGDAGEVCEVGVELSKAHDLLGSTSGFEVKVLRADESVELAVRVDRHCAAARAGLWEVGRTEEEGQPSCTRSPQICPLETHARTQPK